jgi:Icc-related predicted phosphoesterase|tara:strand:+ start:4775 stop:5380 length:606 start_codon:yes stop_codon:yes gene_type:complete
MSKLKILAASDIHGDSSLTKSLANRAQKENVDLVILCGDLTGWSDSNNIIKPFKSVNKPLLLIPGNWESVETADLLASLYQVKNLHGTSSIYKEIGFFGAGGAEGPGPGRISDSQILEALKTAYQGVAGIEKKVMITHSHPAESKSEFSGIPGSQSITEAISLFKPSLVLHGHIHEAAGFEEQIGQTRVINVGRQGQIIEI